MHSLVCELDHQHVAQIRKLLKPLAHTGGKCFKPATRSINRGGASLDILIPYDDQHCEHHQAQLVKNYHVFTPKPYNHRGVDNP